MNCSQFSKNSRPKIELIFDLLQALVHALRKVYVRFFVAKSELNVC